VPDLPDFYTWVETLNVQASSLKHGADADKASSPDDGDIYIATDTEKFYICYVDGSWVEETGLYLPKAGGTMSGAIAMGSQKITGLAAPTSDNDAARKKYVDDGLALKLALAGGTMSGAIAMGTQKITGMGDPTAAQDAATKTYVDSAIDTDVATHAGLTATHGVSGKIADIADAIKWSLVLGG
tara:strand:- start:9500 stop:10051 length:552 start_codon:yes stop_codon:yes gene_type:complete